MRDLEIRGAGNLLGAEQSGHIAAVGFDLYVEMVTEAVGELTGEMPRSARRSADRPAGHRAPAARLHRARRRAHGGVPPTRRGHDRGRRRRRARRVGRPLRPAAAARPRRCSTSRGCEPNALRLGIRAVSVQKGRARFDGLELRKSQEVRLQRLVTRAQVLPDAVIVPVAATADVLAAAGVAQVAPGDRSRRKRPRYAPPDETSTQVVRRARRRSRWSAPAAASGGGVLEHA